MEEHTMRARMQCLLAKARAYTKQAIAAVLGLAMIMTMGLVTRPIQAEESGDERVADPTTFTQWEQGIGNPTDPRSTGRVWTDKSVSTGAVTLTTYDGKTVQVTPKHDDAFLVGLSAMSSAQRITGVANVTKPLDIVLVLDTSATMNYDMDDDRHAYNPVYNLDTSKTYYVQKSNPKEYWSVTYKGRNWVNSKGEVYTPKTSASSRGTQFYTYDFSATRMAAMQAAAGGFIDQLADANEKIQDVNKKNRLGVVTFASTATKRSGLTYDEQTMTAAISGLRSNGSTHSEAGLEAAKELLEQSQRADATSIVIFFTDGEPSSGSGFDATLANTAVTTATAI